MGDITKNFSAYEFACRCGCGQDDIDMTLVKKLQLVRDAVMRPIIIRSGFRCLEHNASVGGKDDSEHLTGEAVDIECDNSRDRYELRGALKGKFERIGVALNFIHVGVSTRKDTRVEWIYPYK